MPDRQRWGVFGGTFDPLHIGHLVAAETVRHDLGLDRVLFVVAHVPWQKVDDRPVTESAHRLAMVEAALASLPGLEASDVEIRRGGNSYTADTLAELAGADRDLYLVLGSDAAQGLPSWERPDGIRDAAQIVVVDRPGSNGSVPPPGWSWTTVSSPLLDVSSSDLRERLEEGKPVRFLIPDVVLDYAAAHGLYGLAG